MATIAQQLLETRATLAPVAGDLAALEARLLAQYAWGVSHEVLVRDASNEIDENAAQQLQRVVARRVQHEPLAQIVGAKDFWKDSFLVTRDVLTPRADSETMIEAMLRHAPEAPAAVLDLGTGSGCLLLSALREYPQARGVAVDISPDALAVARQNAVRLALDSRAEFVQGQWCNQLDTDAQFDIVLTNPPYIARADVAALDEDVKGFEPHLALDGGIDGLDCYREIFSTVLPYLKPRACVLAEVGIGQSADVKTIGEAAGLHHVETCRDLAGIERIVVFRRNE